jgi:hypothetical protein
LKDQGQDICPDTLYLGAEKKRRQKLPKKRPPQTAHRRRLAALMGTKG